MECLVSDYQACFVSIIECMVQYQAFCVNIGLPISISAFVLLQSNAWFQYQHSSLIREALVRISGMFVSKSNAVQYQAFFLKSWEIPWFLYQALSL